MNQAGNATGACTTSQTVTIKNTAASGAASLTFNLNSRSSYGSVIIGTGSDKTIAQGGNKTYTPTFTLQRALSTTVDNAGTLEISSTDAKNHANVSIDSPQDITIKLVPVVVPSGYDCVNNQCVAGGTYSTLSNCQAACNPQAPTLNKVPNSISCGEKCSVGLELSNPMDYIRVKIFQSFPFNPTDPDLNNKINDKSKYNFLSEVVVPSTIVTSYFFTVSELDYNSTYGFYAKGCLTDACQ